MNKVIFTALAAIPLTLAFAMPADAAAPHDRKAKPAKVAKVKNVSTVQAVISDYDPVKDDEFVVYVPKPVDVSSLKSDHLPPHLRKHADACKIQLQIPMPYPLVVKRDAPAIDPLGNFAACLKVRNQLALVNANTPKAAYAEGLPKGVFYNLQMCRGEAGYQITNKSQPTGHQIDSIFACVVERQTEKQKQSNQLILILGSLLGGTTLLAGGLWTYSRRSKKGAIGPSVNEQNSRERIDPSFQTLPYNSWGNVPIGIGQRNPSPI